MWGWDNKVARRTETTHDSHEYTSTLNCGRFVIASTRCKLLSQFSVKVALLSVSLRSQRTHDSACAVFLINLFAIHSDLGADPDAVTSSLASKSRWARWSESWMKNHEFRAS